MLAAPTLPVLHPLQHFAAIEYPGKVSSASSSVEMALEALGGLPKVSATLAQTDPNLSIVELDLNVADTPTSQVSFLHPIPGDTATTANLVLKVRRRKRRARALNGEEDARVPLPGQSLASKGIYKVEVVGVITHTVRFRCQFGPFLPTINTLIVILL